MQSIFLAESLDRGLERAEAQAQAHPLVVGERLAMEDEERVVVEGLPDVRPGAIVERLSQIHPADLDAEAGVQCLHRERAGGDRHRLSFRTAPDDAARSRDCQGRALTTTRAPLTRAAAGAAAIAQGGATMPKAPRRILTIALVFALAWALQPARAADVKLTLWRLKTYIPPADKILDTTAQDCAKKMGAEVLTKNGDGRVVYLTPELKTLLTAQLERVQALERTRKDSLNPDLTATASPKSTAPA